MDKCNSSTLPPNRIPSSEPYLQPEYQAERVASIVKAYLEDIEFVPSGINPVNEALEDYMKNFMHSHGLKWERIEYTLHAAASLTELGYYKSTLDEKKKLALFTWFALYVDDTVAKNPIPFREFGSRLLRGQPQLDPVLTKFTELLHHMWDLYDPLVANAIFSYSVAFVMGCCIESGLENIPLAQGVDRFPYYIRDLTGLSNAYALMAFPKTGNFDMLSIVQALPDMNAWTNLSNDLLSFHKEESKGEKWTYIYNRAQNDNKSRYETCVELRAELKKISQTIYTALAGNPEALERWKVFEHGYVEWHLIQERYRIKDLGIDF